MQLVRRAQADDSLAMDELFARYLPRVRQITAIRLGRTQHELLDADDITQEAMSDAFRNLQQFDSGSDGKFCNWLSALVQNRIRMALRSGQAKKRGGGNVKRFADQQDTVRASHLRGHEATPSQHARVSETNEQMEQALQQLSETNRELIVQRYYCQMTYEEIAEAMEYDNTDTARAAYSRALRALRAVMPTP